MNPISLVLHSLFQYRFWAIASFPFLFYYPTFTICLVLILASFLLGLVFHESCIDENGGFGLVMKHYEKRFPQKEQNIPDIKKSDRNLDIVLEPQLDSALDKFVGFIVRDFINGWYDNLNQSKSSEFPDAVHESLKICLIQLGMSISKTNPTDVILAIMKKVIEHVKEYRKFDLTELDIQDYLKENPESSFARIHSRELITEKLRDQSMKLILHCIARNDRNSGIVFSFCREILATTVLLPVIDKITHPTWLNENLLNVLKKKEAELENTVSNTETSPEASQTLQTYSSEQWLAYLQLSLEQIQQLVENSTKHIENADPDDMIDLLQKKLESQKQVEELMDIISSFKETVLSNPIVSVAHFKITVEYEEIEAASQIMGAFQFMTASNQGKFLIHLNNQNPYTVEKSFKDLQDISTILGQKYQRIANANNKLNLQEFKKEESRQYCVKIQEWFFTVLSDPVCSLYTPFVLFLQPSVVSEPELQKKGSQTFRRLLKSASNMELSFQLALNQAGSAFSKLSDSNMTHSEVTEEVETKPLIESSVVSQQDLDVILDVIFTAIEELFSLTNPDQWIRQQSLHLIKVVLKRAFGFQIASAIATKLEAGSSQIAVSGSINSLADYLWPDGRKWGTGPPPEIMSSHEQARITHQLFCLLSDQEQVKKSDEFTKVVSNIQSFLGSKNTKTGFLRGFHLLQNQQLNAGLCCEIIEVFIAIVTDLM